jgi:hypothetical protein
MYTRKKPNRILLENGNKMLTARKSFKNIKKIGEKLDDFGKNMHSNIKRCLIQNTEYNSKKTMQEFYFRILQY